MLCRYKTLPVFPFRVKNQKARQNSVALLVAKNKINITIRRYFGQIRQPC